MIKVAMLAVQSARRSSRHRCQRLASKRRLACIGAVLIAGVLSLAHAAGGARPDRAQHLVPHWRYPVAQAVSADGQFLFVGNERSGTLSIVSTTKQAVAQEIEIGGSIAALRWAGDHRLAMVDTERHELILCDVQADRVSVQHRIAVSSYPVDLQVSDDGRECYVTSLWSRRLSKIAIPLDAKPQVVARIDMPFAPRRQLLAERQGQLIVADSHGGRLALVRLSDFKLTAVREFPAHNIRGLAASPDGETLLVSHQMLNELAHTVRGDVHWGLLMSNDMRWLRMKIVLDPKRKIYSESHMHPLGEAGSATAAPAQLAISKNGVVVVALAGVGEVAIGKEDDFSLGRIDVGQRPRSVVIDDQSERAYVANMYDDSISVLDLISRKIIQTISLGPTSELKQLDRGERLFFDASLSHDSWMSCHSCHTDGHTNGMLNDNLTDATFGAPKRVLTLLGKAHTEPLAWNASSDSFPEQVRKSIEMTMQKDHPPTDEQVQALTAYILSLAPPPPIDVARGEFDADSVSRGKALFVKRKCAKCHAAPTYTTPKLYDVGLIDQLGKKRFNPPSLLGVGQRGPYFHDNRAESVADIFQVHGHQRGGKRLTQQELNDLVAFLRSL